MSVKKSPTTVFAQGQCGGELTRRGGGSNGRRAVAAAATRKGAGGGADRMSDSGDAVMAAAPPPSGIGGGPAPWLGRRKGGRSTVSAVELVSGDGGRCGRSQEGIWLPRVDPPPPGIACRSVAARAGRYSCAGSRCCRTGSDIHSVHSVRPSPLHSSSCLPARGVTTARAVGKLHHRRPCHHRQRRQRCQ